MVVVHSRWFAADNAILKYAELIARAALACSTGMTTDPQQLGNRDSLTVADRIASLPAGWGSDGSSLPNSTRPLKASVGVTTVGE